MESIATTTCVLSAKRGVATAQQTSVTASQRSRTLIVDVGDFTHYKNTGQIVSLWKGDITSTGLSNDLRLVMPMLVEAGFRHFGQNIKKASHMFTLSMIPTSRS
jgi:hypothetical protein